MNNELQHEAWASGIAADAWFERNRQLLDASQTPSKATLLYASYVHQNHKILEVGTANGRALEQIRQLTDCQAYGIDPSVAAISDGLDRYPGLHLSIGTADKLEYPAGFFDVVIFGFCLYIIDRTLLMRVVSEADRVLKDGGKLMVTDFDPCFPHRRPFKHHLGLHTYKMQYPDLWLANPTYRLVEKFSFSMYGDKSHEDPNERIAAWVLCKQSFYHLPEVTE